MVGTDGENATPTASEEPDGGEDTAAADGETNDFFATEAEALDYAGGFAADDAVVVERSADRTPELLEHGGGSGSSWGPADGGGTHTSQDLHFTSIPDDGVQFGGGAGRTLRVRNVTLDKAATFEPDAGSEQFPVATWSIDAEAEGEPPSAIQVRPVGEQQDVMLQGQWRGDTDLFRTQAFGEYVIELVEGGTRIGTTDGAIYGIRYHWGAEQTRETLYVTRQPSTNESWTVALYVGGSRFDPLATQEGTQSAAENVFEVDLTELDLESGQYSWELLVGEGLQLERTHFISLTPSSGDLLIP
ncbi:hypothetical protein [Halogranum gelatinilyticum]|nr:hypothetical protein [Halogranum gelatinilyticum]